MPSVDRSVSDGLVTWTKPLKYWFKRAILRRRPSAYWSLRRLVRGPFEAEVALLARWCRPTGTALDVGANFGAWTDALAPLVEHVHAFEPIPHMAAMLQEVFADRNVSVHAVAVSDHAGRSRLRVPSLALGYSTIHAGNALGDNVSGGGDIDELDIVTIAMGTRIKAARRCPRSRPRGARRARHPGPRGSPWPRCSRRGTPRRAARPRGGRRPRPGSRPLAAGSS